MNDLQSARLLHSAVRCSAVRAVDNLASRCIDGLGQGLALHVLKVGAAEALEEGAPLGFFQQDSGACLEGSVREGDGGT